MILVACADGNLQAWDFTDSCSRPAAELHASHARITTIEFLASSTANARVQLLAVGDATGTLHVFEVPRSLTRPVPKEEQLMLAFFDREQSRGEYVRSMPEIEGFAVSASSLGVGVSLGSSESKKGERHDTANNKSAPGTAGGGPPADGIAPDQVDEVAKALKKEEEDFLKAEAAFIAELGLDWGALPEAIREAHPAPEAKK